MVKNLLALGILGLLGTGGFFLYRAAHEKEALIALQQKELAAQKAAIDNLGRSTRVAQVVVTDQWTGEDGRVRSKVRFVELAPDGSVLQRKTLVAEGKTVYFDALVLKFERGLVGAGDALKGRSLLLFRRVFGEHQQPAEGVALDEADADGIPAAYRAGRQPTDFEVGLWRDFWNFANDPDAAARAGVRVAQGEAPYTRLEKGRIYELTLDHAGGLNIVASKIPAVLLDEGE